MNYLLKYSASALSQTNRAIIQDIARGIPAKNVRKHRAKNSKKQGYRCRIVEPIRAVAELFISCGTLSSAAALGQEAIMPFYAKNKKHRDYHAKNSAHFEKRKRKQHAGRKRGNESGDYEQAV